MEFTSLYPSTWPKEGFWYAGAQGFYDAITAYGLPQSIIDLDHSSQMDVPYRIKTAYGFTDNFSIDGVTKQGGSLSPLKCVLTTSLCNHWLSDLHSSFTGTLQISSTIHIHQTPHTPQDNCILQPSMIEAMDDSLLLYPSLPTLLTMSQHAEHFQATYGWETEWWKRILYAYRSPDFPSSSPQPLSVQVPSIDHINPSADQISYHTVPVETDHTTFLHVPLNRPDLHFLHLQDIVINFSFPLLHQFLPLTALRQILTQSVISKLRPLLTFQSITWPQAQKLDHLLATKVHNYLGFPFPFNSLLLTAPINLQGFGFSSISRLNDSLAIAGLQCDLNHHLPIFKTMANIMLTDWTCQVNGCLTPLNYPGLHHSFQLQEQKLPFSWILAQEVMWEINLPFKATDLSYILQGDISLSHLYHISLSLSPPNTLPVISTCIFTNFQRNGFSTLCQFGRWVLNDQTFLPTHFLPSHPHFPSSMYYLTCDWPLISHWLSLLHSIILPLTKPSPTLLLPKPLQQAFTETVLLSLPSLSQTYTHSTPLHLYASDASMTCHNPDNHSSITFAVVAHQKAFTGSLSKFGHGANILHGEVYGIVVASLLMRKMLQGPTIHPSPILYTNHLNSVNILSSHIPYPHQMSSNPASAGFSTLDEELKV